MAVGVNRPAVGSGTGPLFVRGNRLGCQLYTVDLPNPYATGGVDISAIWGDFKTTSGSDELFIFAQSRAGYVFDINYATKKFVVYRQSAATSALTEVANGVDLSAVTKIRVFVFGNLS